MENRHAPRAFLLVIWSMAILTLLGSSAQAAFPGRNGRIAFVRRSAAVRAHVWTMDADGSSQRRLSPRRGDSPAWSPHGTRIAFSWIRYGFRNGEGIITVVNADSSNLERLTGGPVLSDPRWSPNGRQIVLSGFADALRILIVNTSDGRVTFYAPVPWDNKRAHGPTWSPRGGRIAFEVGPYRPHQDYSTEVFTMTPDGDDLRRLTDNRADEYDLDWSPDGSRLLYVRTRAHGGGRVESDVAMMEKNGHDISLLTHTERNEGSAAFSPNGERIVFDRCCYGDSKTSEIFVMRTDGTHVLRLTNNEVDDTAPDWQPIPRGR